MPKRVDSFELAYGNPCSSQTLDILCEEKLKFFQKKDGYRFSIDAFLIANFVALKKGERLLDIGTGCGIIPIYLAKKGYTNHMLGVEIQDDLFDLAMKNKTLNNISDHIKFLKGDIRNQVSKLKQESINVIVSNPPYTKKHSGRVSPGDSRYIARYESFLNLSELLSTTASLLDKKGRFCVIYPSKRLGELVYTAGLHKLELKRLRLVYPRKNKEANLFLAEFLKEGGIGVKLEEPLYIYENGCNTEEVKKYYTLKG
jgi:tRNA1Val (adenine37-N6)-methyltransferase